MGGGTEPGDPVHQGAIFLDREPVCGRGWDDADARVACRCLLPWSPTRPLSRQLGYPSGVATNGSLFLRVSGSTNFALTYVA